MSTGKAGCPNTWLMTTLAVCGHASRPGMCACRGSGSRREHSSASQCCGAWDAWVAAREMGGRGEMEGETFGAAPPRHTNPNHDAWLCKSAPCHPLCDPHQEAPQALGRYLEPPLLQPRSTNVRLGEGVRMYVQSAVASTVLAHMAISSMKFRQEAGGQIVS